MNLLDLPLELFQEILAQCFEARTLRRGLRLRLVNKFFATQLLTVLYNYKLLDQRIRRGDSSLPFAGSYLASRARNEPNDGNVLVTTVRRIALELSSSKDEYDANLTALCTAVTQTPLIPFVNRHFTLFREKKDPSLVFDKEWHDEKWLSTIEHAYQEELMVAAVLVGKDVVVERMMKDSFHLLHAKSLLFGEARFMQSRSCSEKMMDLFLRDLSDSELMKPRCEALFIAAQAGRLDIVKYAYKFRVESVPWVFGERPVSGLDFWKALVTPNPEVFEYVSQISQTHCGDRYIGGIFINVLQICVQLGWTETVRCLLNMCRDLRGTLFHSQLQTAAQRGFVEIVKIMLDHNVDAARAMAKAARGGHREVVQELVEHGADATDALVIAARGGYQTIVELLLKKGCDPNEEKPGFHVEDSPAIVFAVEGEDEQMFNLLLNNGANLKENRIRKRLVETAKRRGLETMSALLESHGIKADDVEM